MPQIYLNFRMLISVKTTLAKHEFEILVGNYSDSITYEKGRTLVQFTLVLDEYNYSKF